MMFATVAGNPTRAETEKISALWESSLFNANIQLKRCFYIPLLLAVALADACI